MLLNPVIPFEPVAAHHTPTGAQWIAQIKWDGVRMLAYHDGEETRLINRKLNERTKQYPEFVMNPERYCKSSTFILDGEFIAFDKNKPSFHEIMRRDSVRKAENIAKAAQQVPVTYMIFDVIYADGLWVTSKPLSERQKLLEQIVNPQPDVQLAQNFTDQEQLLGVMRQHGMEGIVCKDLTSTYAVGGKDGRWIKRKVYLDLYAVIGGVTHRSGIINALLLGLYDADGRLWYIGHAGTGKVSSAEWRTLTEEMKPLAVHERPFANEPERLKDAVWVEPRRVVRVQYAELTPGGTLRQPSIQAFVQMPAPECVLNQLRPG